MLLSPLEFPDPPLTITIRIKLNRNILSLLQSLSGKNRPWEGRGLNQEKCRSSFKKKFSSICIEKNFLSFVVWEWPYYILLPEHPPLQYYKSFFNGGGGGGGVRVRGCLLSKLHSLVLQTPPMWRDKLYFVASYFQIMKNNINLVLREF